MKTCYVKYAEQIHPSTDWVDHLEIETTKRLLRKKSRQRSLGKLGILVCVAIFFLISIVLFSMPRKEDKTRLAPNPTAIPSTPAPTVPAVEPLPSPQISDVTILEYPEEFYVNGMTASDDSLVVFGANGLEIRDEKSHAIELYDSNFHLRWRYLGETKGEVYLDAIVVDDQVVAVRTGEDESRIIEHISEGILTYQSDALPWCRDLFPASEG